MKQQAVTLKALLAPTVESMGYEYVGSELVGGSRQKKLRVFIDEPNVGITVDDCAEVSRQISAILDVEDVIRGEYRLEVSSPGWERPLFELAHYARFVGERAFVKLYNALAGRKNFTGIIASVDDETITLESDEHAISFNIDEVRRAHLSPED